MPCLAIYVVLPKQHVTASLPSTPDLVGTLFAQVTQTVLAYSSTPSATVLPSATYTPQASQTSTQEPKDIRYFALSFYDPNIGQYFPDKALDNCAVYDWSRNECISKVRNNSDDWRDWIGRGAACPKSLADDTRFIVIEPVQLAGHVWQCIDRGDLDRNGLSYIDFMLHYPDQIWTGRNLNDFPWSSSVVIEVLK